jgi:cold shock CspA family protein
MLGTRNGTVSEFDGASGLGVVSDVAGERWPFHCVSIVDGTRTIEPGTPVEFVVEVRVSRLEAVSIRPVASSPG